MILISPVVITSISFQLSVFATLGIILFASDQNKKNKDRENKGIGQNNTALSLGAKSKPDTVYSRMIGLFKECSKVILSVFKENFAVTIAAQVFTVPLILFHFHRVSLIGPVANAVVGWLIAPITYLGFIVVFAGLVFEPLGRVMGFLVYVPLTIFIQLVYFFSSIPFASFKF